MTNMISNNIDHSDHSGGSVARVVRMPDLNLEILSSSPALTTSWICLGSPWFNSSAALVHSQLVCLLPVGILNLLSSFQLFVSLALKSPSG